MYLSANRSPTRHIRITSVNGHGYLPQVNRSDSKSLFRLLASRHWFCDDP